MRRNSAAIPRYVLDLYGCDARDWKSLKRFQLSNAIRVFDKLYCGSAFINDPDGETDKIYKAFEALKRRLRVKEWGR